MVVVVDVVVVVVVVVGATLNTPKEKDSDEVDDAPFEEETRRAVITYEIVDDNTVGVPEINPVEVLNDRPAGRLGEIEYSETAPPVFEIEYKDPTDELIIPNPELLDNAMFGAEGALPQRRITIPEPPTPAIPSRVPPPPPPVFA